MNSMAKRTKEYFLQDKHESAPWGLNIGRKVDFLTNKFRRNDQFRYIGRSYGTQNLIKVLFSTERRPPIFDP